MIHHIDHIGIAVESLEDSVPLFERLLGQPCGGIETVEDQHVRTAFFRFGNMSLELLEPLEGNTGVAAFLEKRGQGMHHVALASDDVAADLTRIGASGARLIDSVPRPGAGGKSVGFVHPKSASGVLVELCGPGGDSHKTSAV